MNTQKLEHSPGPWVAVGKVVRDCWGRKSVTVARADSRGKFVEGYDEANARLIAAAPEMLAALREIETLTQRMTLPSDTKQGWEPVAVERMAQIAEKTRKIIAKAKGGAE